MKDVTAAIIVENGRVLLARRAPGEKHVGKWEFPGGKIESSETPEECLQRELFEEFGVQTEVKDFVAESIHEYTQGVIRLVAYTAELKGGKICPQVHDAVEWVRVEDLLDYDLLHADIPIAKFLIRHK